MILLKIDLKPPYEIAEQFSVLLQALEAIQPFADRGGITTTYSEAYDEWENIVDALDTSFMVQPIVDTQTTYGTLSFAKLGYSNEGGSKLLRFQIEIKGQKFLLHDIGLSEDGHFKLLTFRNDLEVNELLAIGAKELRYSQGLQLVSSTRSAPEIPFDFSI